MYIDAIPMHHPQEQLLLEPMFEVPGSDIAKVVIEEDTARGYHPARYEHKPPEEADSSDQCDQVDQQDQVDQNASDSTDRPEIKTSVL